MFTEGIRIFYQSTDREIKRRIYLSDGVQLNGEVIRKGASPLPYLPDRYIPKMPWRPASEEESDLLLINPAVPDRTVLSETVSILGLPDPIIEKLRLTGIHLLTSADQLNASLQTKKQEFDALNHLLASYLRSMLPNNGSLEFQGIRVSYGNLLTTAHTPDLKLVGLHIDNASGRDPLDFQPEKRRLCINLGPEDRYFLFVNKTIEQIIAMVSRFKKIDKTTYSNENSLSDDFFKFYPEYPIVRIRQRPYDIYIAPTDSLIHDGSTEHNNSTDIDMTFLGDFLNCPPSLAASAH